jgi:peptidoglycan/LPS O-acetylase OafA/YrhL
VVTIVLLLLSRMAGTRAYHYSLGFTIDAILVAVFIAQVLLLHDRVLWRWLDHPIPRYLGAISYPLYLYHIWGYGAARRLLPAGPSGLRVIVAIAVSIALASLSYYVVERPFMRLKARFSSAGNNQAVRSLEPVAAP